MPPEVESPGQTAPPTDASPAPVTPVVTTAPAPAPTPEPSGDSDLKATVDGLVKSMGEVVEKLSKLATPVAQDLSPVRKVPWTHRGGGSNR